MSTIVFVYSSCCEHCQAVLGVLEKHKVDPIRLCVDNKDQRSRFASFKIASTVPSLILVQEGEDSISVIEGASECISFLQEMYATAPGQEEKEAGGFQPMTSSMHVGNTIEPDVLLPTKSAKAGSGTLSLMEQAKQMSREREESMKAQGGYGTPPAN